MKLSPVIPYVFEGYLVLALSSDWTRVFDKVTFDVAIVKGRLQITSSQRIRK